MIKYNQEHFEKWKKTKSLQGVKGGKTNKIWADFDHKGTDLKNSFKEAYTFYERLKATGMKDENIEISFSGNKGIGFIVNTNHEFTNEQVQSICTKLAEGLNTFDTTMYDHQRIFRLLLTKNEKSGLYKIPLKPSELKEANVDEVKKLASDLDNFDRQSVLDYYETFQVTDKILSMVVEEPNEQPKLDLSPIDFTKKPKQWRNCKWALLQGNFKSGERHQALMVIAATARGLGYDKETAYYLCKSALKKQAAITGTEEFPKEELYTNIIDQSVYKTNWEGGQFSCQKPGWLQTYCKGLDHPCETHSESNTVKIEDAFTLFKDYATNIDQLTVKTGIPILDKKLRMTVGMSVGIVAPPGVGKTSVALQMLNNMSKANEQSLFLSYDMFHALVFQKLIQKHFNIQPDEIFKRFKDRDTTFEAKVMEVIKQEYKNVHFCFKAGQTYSEIQDTIKEAEDTSGKKVKLLVCDYNELVLTDMSDSTSSSNYVAQKMREIANVNQTCVLSLFQPNKLSGSPADEITSYRSAKGGSGIEQSVSIMLGMSRPGYDPRKPENDRFMSINCLKNRMGSLFGVDLYWDGLTGSLREMTQEEKDHLDSVRQAKEDEKNQKKDDWS
jgi:adenylate kinase